MTCEKCDAVRARRLETRHLVGRPCDICDGRGWDYLGRRCRHCSEVDAPEENR
jgi:hypothetical protein